MLSPFVRRLLLPILFLIAAAASAQTLVTFTFAGTAKSTDAGYTYGDPVNFTFVLSTAALPPGHSNSPYVDWIRSSSNHPSASLFSSVTATGMTGTWNGTDSSSGVTDDEIVINTSNSPSVLAFQSDADNGNLRLFSPDTHAATFIYIQGQWTGLSLVDASIADPIAYFAARTGTYNLALGSDSAYVMFSGGATLTYLPSTLTISAMAIPEPATEATFAGLGVLLFAFVRRRRKAG